MQTFEIRLQTETSKKQVAQDVRKERDKPDNTEIRWDGIKKKKRWNFWKRDGENRKNFKRQRTESIRIKIMIIRG